MLTTKNRKGWVNTGNSRPNSSKATVTTFINYSGGSRYFKFKGYTQIGSVAKF